MSVINNLKKRLDINNDSDNYLYYNKEENGLKNMQARLNSRGGTDQWTRMREDKLRSLKKALLSSYQSAIVQKYDVKKDSLAKNIISIITKLQDPSQEITETENLFLQQIEKEYGFLNKDRTSITYIYDLNNIVTDLTESQPLFRCLINHDKLKVDYQDKIISIPFEQPPVGQVDPIETNFHNGTVFKWVHGNKEEWTPDTYWIVYMQYSQETAYFRAEIRKADEQINIITIDDEGNESSVTYRGWMTGPNETSALWNTKKGVTWNDMNYTKILYITKAENTTAFFQRFDRIIINGKPWQVQAYNESYSTSKTSGTDTGIIRVALKQTYTNTDQFIKQLENNENNQIDIAQKEEPYIDGPSIVYPYDECIYTLKNTESYSDWTISKPALVKIKQQSQNKIKIEIITGYSNKDGFDIQNGDISRHIEIGSI